MKNDCNPLPEQKHRVDSMAQKHAFLWRVIQHNGHKSPGRGGEGGRGWVVGWLGTHTMHAHNTQREREIGFYGYSESMYVLGAVYI
jgi:hypothetical protein